jgi:phosphate starvation-inducible protein PhoH and related proteins
MRSKKVTRKSKSVYQTKALSKDRNSYRANYNSQLSYRDTAKQLTEFQPVSSKIQTTKFIKPLNQRQRDYVRLIKDKTVVIASGDSGTSKSFLSLHTAIQLYNDESSPIEKIFYIRANVGLGEERDLGYLKGSLQEKIIPLAYPVMDSLIGFMSEGQAKYLIETSKIEVLPVAMVRGRTFNNSIVIVDEAQSCSPSSILTLLTRIGQDSKMILIGNTSSYQKDSQSYIKDGLEDAINRLAGLPDVGYVRFQREDIVRNSVIKDILARYED